MNKNEIIWYSRCPVPSATGIAIRNGWFDSALQNTGAVVRSLASSTDRSVRQSHFDQNQQFLFRHGGNGPPLIAMSRGAGLRIIGLSWHDVYRPILTMPGSGITKAADLKGRRLSFPKRAKDPIDFWQAAALRGYSDTLESVGLSLSDVELVDVSTDRAFVDETSSGGESSASLWGAEFMLGHQREEAFALIQNKVDAIYSHGAIAVTVQGFTGAKTVCDISEIEGLRRAGNNDCPLVFTASTGLLETNPTVMPLLLNEANKAARWAADNAEEANRIVAAEVGIAEELTPKAYSPRLPAQLDIDLSPDRIAALEAQVAHLYKAGFISTMVDLDRMIDPAPLEASKKLALTNAA